MTAEDRRRKSEADYARDMGALYEERAFTNYFQWVQVRLATLCRAREEARERGAELDVHALQGRIDAVMAEVEENGKILEELARAVEAGEKRGGNAALLEFWAGVAERMEKL